MFEDLNNEDKLFINRIIYLTFRKKGLRADFSDFLKYCKILQ